MAFDKYNSRSSHGTFSGEFGYYEDYRIYNNPQFSYTDKNPFMQIPNRIKDCVVFLGGKTPVGTYNPKGTGFLASYPVGANDRYFQFLVTAQHNIDSLLKSNAKEVGLRVNTKSGGAKWIDMPLEKWFTVEDPTCDIVLLSINLDVLDPNLDWEQSCFPLTAIADEAFLDKWEVREGDEVFTIGLYGRYRGKNRNVPIVRIGNISTMEQADIPTKLAENTRAYLIESRSIGGLSGSPVFVNLGNIRLLAREQKPNETKISFSSTEDPIFALLGVTHGHFDTEEGGEVVNEGIAIVIPATRILEILSAFQHELIGHRERILAETAATMDSPK